MAWTYGEAGLAYPVKDEEAWEVGEHVFVCSDLMATSVYDEILEGYHPTLLYCDPPWGQALVNGFRTKAGLGKALYRWEDLYRRVAEFGHWFRIPTWIEGSKAESRDGQKIPAVIANQETREFDSYYPTTYYGKNPAGLYYAGTIAPPDALVAELPGMDDEHTPGAVMEAYARGTVIDPCAGQGLTAWHANQLGWKSVTNELNPRRMSAALVRLAEATGQTPRLA